MQRSLLPPLLWHLPLAASQRPKRLTQAKTATFSVTASGTSLNYQWRKNGINIPGATASSYTTPATDDGDSGAAFTVVVSNSAGGVTSSIATLTVYLVAPAITTQPAAQTVSEGQSATFSVTASGTSPNYQWRKNGTNILGATSSSYTTPVTAIGDSGAVFSVVVSNSAGGVTSSSATLTVNLAAPTITTQPAAQTVSEGQSATFSVTASSTSLSYQWRKNGTNIPGATSSSYTTPVTAIGDSGAVFSVVVSNSAGGVTSSSATLTVVAVLITTQPSAQSVVAGQTASFTVTATGTAPLTYQWRKNGTDISGATSSSYTTPAISSADNGAVFTVVVSNSAGTVTSNSATLTVVAVLITTQPSAQSVVAGQTATFTVTATGTAPLTYQWRKNGTNISGATSSTYTTPATVIEDNAAVFTVVVSNSAGTVTSNSATLTVVALFITTQPSAQSVVVGQTARFSVTATGTGLTYRWRKNGSNISGATSSTYTTPATVIGDNNAVFTVVVSNSASTAISSNATLSVFATRYSEVANASGGTYANTECVKDNTTGLVWEGKTASPATTRLGTSVYRNYDSTSSAQKLNGTNPTQTEIDASTNSIGYRDSVRNSYLCGYNDWRMPTKEELQGILASSGSPRIDTTWFPNTRANNYWSSSPDVGGSSNAWHVSFSDGRVATFSRDASMAVRLVRASQ